MITGLDVVTGVASIVAAFFGAFVVIVVVLTMLGAIGRS